MRPQLNNVIASIEEYLKTNEPDTLETLLSDGFNSDYYIIGRFQAAEFLAQENSTFQIIGIVKEYHTQNFGECNVDFTEPEQIVNHFVYIVADLVTQNLAHELGLDLYDTLESETRAKAVELLNSIDFAYEIQTQLEAY